MRHVSRREVLAVLGSLSAGTCALAAEAFPGERITFVVPFSAGGAADAVARALAEALRDKVSASIVIDNKVGGATVIGTQYVARSAPDGQTWLLLQNATTINVALLPKGQMDVLRDFVPAAKIGKSFNYLVVAPDLPVKTLEEFIAYAKARPGQLSYGSAGPGSTPHLGFEVFKQLTGIDVMHVPYKGMPPLLPDLMSGRLHVAYMPAALTVANAKSGKFRVLATVASSRSAELPEVPTLQELGYRGADVVNPFWAVGLPSGTPASIVRAVQNLVESAVKTPAFAQRLKPIGAEPEFLASQETSAFLAADVNNMKSIVAKLNLGQR